MPLTKHTASENRLMENRVHSDKFHAIHKILAYMLDAPRQCDQCCRFATKKKLISYSRGEITILDRIGLEAACCVCYRADQEIYEHLLGYPRNLLIGTSGFVNQSERLVAEDVSEVSLRKNRTGKPV